MKYPISMYVIGTDHYAGGFAAACFDAADGDPLGAIVLACDAMVRLRPQAVASMRFRERRRRLVALRVAA